MKLMAVNDRPRVHEDDFDIKEDEQHGHEVKFDRKTGMGGANRILAALVSNILGGVAASPFAEKKRHRQSGGGKESACHNLEKNRHVIVGHKSSLSDF